MPGIADSVASLRIFGDGLIPEAVSARVGAAPTSSYRKGDVEQMRSGSELKRNTGMWLLEAPRREPEDLDAQIAEILSRLTQDIEVWKALTQEFEIDLYCGLFMGGTDEGLCLSPSTMAALGERGIELAIEVYAPTPAITPTDPCPCKSNKSYEECCGSQPKA